MKIKPVRYLVIPIVLLFLSCNTTQIGSLLGQAPKPSIKATNVRVAGIDFQGIDLAFDMDVDNPYSVPIHSPRFKYGLDIEKSEFIKSEATSKVDLPAKGTGRVTLPVRVGYLDLLRTYQQLKNQSEVAYTLRSAVLLDAMGQTIELPVTQSGTFPVLRVPRISALEVKPSGVTMSGAQLGVKAAITNPNLFPLNVANLGYLLKLGEIEIGGLSASTAAKVQPGQTEQILLNTKISGMQALNQLLSGDSLGGAKVFPTGALETPYGKVNIPDQNVDE